MSTKETYEKKMETELDALQARLDEFKAQAEGMNADARLRHATHVEEVERHIAATKTKLQELNEADGDVWQQLVGGVENTWKVLQSTLEDAITSFED